MYYCNTCHSFVTGKIYSTGPESESPLDVECEICGNTDVEDVDYCPYCGEPKRSCDDMCDACDSTVANITEESIKSVQDALDTDFDTAKDLLIGYLDQ